MTLQIYPTLAGLGADVKWTPNFFNQSQKAINGASIDIGLAATPLWDFELTYALLRDRAVTFPAALRSEFRNLLGFYLVQQGSLGRFLFLNPDDNIVTSQLVGIGDGTTTTFTIVRNFNAFDFGVQPGQSGIQEPVGAVDTSGANPLNVYVNLGLVAAFPASAALIGGGAAAQTVTLGSAPPAGQHVTMDFSFWYYVKFAVDNPLFEKFADKYWQITSVKLQSCRAGA